MFRKLLKYDMQAIFKVWWIVAVITLGASVLGGIGFRLVMESTSETSNNPLLVLMMLGGIIFFIISVIALAASFILTEIMIFWRYYKNFFSDEGYLTFTLPVSRQQLFLSKTVNAMIWSILHAIVVGIGFIIMSLIIPPTDNGFLINPIVLTSLTDGLVYIIDSLGAWTIVYAIEALIIVFFYLLFTVSLVHMCITIGSVIAKKLKLLAAIGIFYAVNTVLSFVGQLAWIFVVNVVIEGADVILIEASKSARNLVSALLVLIGCAIIAALAFTAYCITQRLLERKLNLA